jgi:non-ribosomal peptide synthetase component F
MPEAVNGPKGPNGPDDPEGPDGPNGPNGPDGRDAGARSVPVSVRRLPGLLLRRRAANRPDAMPFLGCSFADLDRRARAVAARLGLVVPPGSRILLAYPQGVDLAGAFFGCLYAGMSAVPLVAAGAGGPDRPGAIAQAVERCRPAAVLTGGDAWTSLAVDRSRTQVIEADGSRVGGERTDRLAASWQPVGVLRSAVAYERYVAGGAGAAGGLGGGRLEPPLRHCDLGELLGELARAAQLGTPEESVGWIASVHGLEEAVWRILLPVVS